MEEYHSTMTIALMILRVIILDLVELEEYHRHSTIKMTMTAALSFVVGASGRHFRSEQFEI